MSGNRRACRGQIRRDTPWSVYNVYYNVLYNIFLNVYYYNCLNKRREKYLRPVSCTTNYEVSDTFVYFNLYPLALLLARSHPKPRVQDTFQKIVISYKINTAG